MKRKTHQTQAVDVRSLYTRANPNMNERLALDLAVALEARANPKYSVVSWVHQVQAAEYVNTHGTESAFAFLAELEDETE